jgi:hypothetical protein
MVRWESPPSRRRKPGDPGYHGGRWDPNPKPDKKPGCTLAVVAVTALAWLVRRQLR